MACSTRRRFGKISRPARVGGVHAQIMLAAAIAFAAVLAGHRVEAGPVLDAVKARGQLVCDVGESTAGFMQVDRQGKWTGFAVDICRAVAAAILRDAGQGVDFTGIYYYDGQGFLVKRGGAKAVKDLHRANICFQAATTTEANLADYFRAQKLRFTPFAFDRAEEAKAAFLAGRCDALTASPPFTQSSPATPSSPRTTRPAAVHFQGTVQRDRSPGRRSIHRHRALDPVRHDRGRGVRHHLQERRRDADPTIKSILCVTPGMGKALGVDDRWVYAIVKQVGNYGESYDRNLGDGSPLKISRGLNALWTTGGLLYVPPIR